MKSGGKMLQALIQNQSEQRQNALLRYKSCYSRKIQHSFTVAKRKEG